MKIVKCLICMNTFITNDKESFEHIHLLKFHYKEVEDHAQKEIENMKEIINRNLENWKHSQFV